MTGLDATVAVIGVGYEGVVPRPDWYEAMKSGIPGIHFAPEG